MPTSAALRVLARGDWGTLIEKRLHPGEQFGVHQHDSATITLTFAGGYVEDFGTGLLHDVEAGRVQLKSPGIPHTTNAGSGGTLMWIVTPSAAPAAEAGATLSAAPGVATGRMVALHEAATLRDAPAVAAHVRALMAALASSGTGSRPPGPRWLDAVADAQREALDERHSLAAIAGRFGVHPVYLARAFRARFGCSPGAYRHRARIDLAVRRLWNEDAPLAGLAAELGFADQSHFTRVFRRHAGLSPARFQRRAAGRHEVPIVQDRGRAAH